MRPGPVPGAEVAVPRRGRAQEGLAVWLAPGSCALGPRCPRRAGGQWGPGRRSSLACSTVTQMDRPAAGARQLGAPRRWSSWLRCCSPLAWGHMRQLNCTQGPKAGTQASCSSSSVSTGPPQPPSGCVTPLGRFLAPPHWRPLCHKPFWASSKGRLYSISLIPKVPNQPKWQRSGTEEWEVGVTLRDRGEIPWGDPGVPGPCRTHTGAAQAS